MKYSRIKNFIDLPAVRPVYKKALDVYRSYRYNKFTLDYPSLQSPSLAEDQIMDYNRNRRFGASDLICHAPFNNMYFNIYGEVLVCCWNKSYSIGNIREHSLKNIWFGEKADKLRIYIKNYDLDHGCQKCLRKFNAGDYSSLVASSYDYPPGQPSGMPSRMTFELYNVCNLECIMCSGNYSHLIRKKQRKTTDITFRIR